MWEWDYKESWALKNWCFWTVVLEETLESPPWTARRSNQSILKEISPEYSLEGLMLKLKLHTVATWCEEWLTRKDPDAGKDWRGRRGRQSMRRLDGHEFEQVLGSGNGQESLACCSPWGDKESDVNDQLNWTELNWLSLARNCTSVQHMFKGKVTWWHPSHELPSYESEAGIK